MHHAYNQNLNFVKYNYNSVCIHEKNIKPKKMKTIKKKQDKVSTFNSRQEQATKTVYTKIKTFAINKT